MSFLLCIKTQLHSQWATSPKQNFSYFTTKIIHIEHLHFPISYFIFFSRPILKCLDISMTMRTLKIIHRRTLQVDFLGMGQKNRLTYRAFFIYDFKIDFFYTRILIHIKSIFCPILVLAYIRGGGKLPLISADSNVLYRWVLVFLYWWKNGSHGVWPKKRHHLQKNLVLNVFLMRDFYFKRRAWKQLTLLSDAV